MGSIIIIFISLSSIILKYIKILVIESWKIDTVFTIEYRISLKKGKRAYRT